MLIPDKYMDNKIIGVFQLNIIIFIWYLYWITQRMAPTKKKMC